MVIVVLLVSRGDLREVGPVIGLFAAMTMEIATHVPGGERAARGDQGPESRRLGTR
jgi:hypothetical protein